MRRNRFFLNGGLILFFIFTFAGPAQAKDEEVVDPFEPAVVQPTGETQTVHADLDLQGIGIGPGKAYAIINGEVLSQGEERDGLKVVKINKKDVDVLYGSEEMKLRISSPKEGKK